MTASLSPKPRTPLSRPRFALLLLALVVGLLGGGLFLAHSLGSAPKGAAPLAKQLPPHWEGATITFPNRGAGGQALPVPVYDGDGSDPQAAVHSASGTPGELSETLSIPIVGPCEVKANGHLDAPHDWTKGCYYRDARGGLAYLGHSLRGPKESTFERVAKLPVGTVLTIGGKSYRVARAVTVPSQKLPDYLWRDGSISLITCQTDRATDAGGEFTHDRVLVLEEA